MKTKRLLSLGVVAVAVGIVLAASAIRLSGQQNAAITIDNDDIAGVVTSANGPEAGVWVIAETRDLPTRFARIVVTDDQGRYLCLISARQTTTYGCAATVLSIRRRSKRSGKDSQSQSSGGTQRSRRGAILSVDLLVFDDEDSGQERVWRQGENSREIESK